MADVPQPADSGSIDLVTLGATRADGGTRSVSYKIGGWRTLPFLGDRPAGVRSPLVALEVCDDPRIWPAVVTREFGDLAGDTAAWAREAEKRFSADLVRLVLTSTRDRNFSDLPRLGRTVETVLSATGLPIIIEGSNEAERDREVFQRCGEAGSGERLLLGTAEADRYRSVAAAALAYGHSVIAQSPIDINLAKQLNILLREIGVPHDRIVIDPYTGALGYGFEYLVLGHGADPGCRPQGRPRPRHAHDQPGSGQPHGEGGQGGTGGVAAGDSRSGGSSASPSRRRWPGPTSSL